MKTSAFESVSASLCLMSRAIEKKTSSTFMLVFALCISIISALKTAQWFWNDFPTRVLSAAYSFEKLDTVFICQSLTLWSWNSLRRIICSIKCSILIIGDMCTCITKRMDKEWVCVAKPFCFHPCQPCSPLISCWRCQKHAAQCCESNSWCLDMRWNKSSSQLNLNKHLSTRIESPQNSKLKSWVYKKKNLVPLMLVDLRKHML
jgi:hypothetical protein